MRTSSVDKSDIVSLNFVSAQKYDSAYHQRESPQQQGITNYFDVKSVQEYSAKVEKLGGKVISPKMPVPGMGYFAICTDTENNTFGIFEPDQTAK